MKVLNVKENKGFEIQFYNEEGDHSYVVACNNTEEVALCLANWCWARLHGNCPTVWLDGNKWKGLMI